MDKKILSNNRKDKINLEQKLPIFQKNFKEAKEFFLQDFSYCNLNLPSYFKFGKILKQIDKNFQNKILNYQEIKKAKEKANINYKIYDKKNKNDYRKFQLIHPFLYVSLVNLITNEVNWKEIQELFKESLENIKCESVPLYYIENKDFNRKQHSKLMINHWLKNVEERSVELSLEYEYVIHTDIANCYPSLYTHSISWAIMGKDKAKNKNERGYDSHFANKIDHHIQAMQYGQTNGIPQGSVLMDSICEIVLRYIDKEIQKKIKENKIDYYQIIRYRDDYRIFGKSKEDCEKILKILTEILGEYNFYLNPNKTISSDDLVKSAYKIDKYNAFDFIGSNFFNKKNIKENCLILKKFSEQYPNCGVLEKNFSDLAEIISKNNSLIKENDGVLLAILLDVAINNPRTFTSIITIISYFVKEKDLFNKICVKIHKSQYVDFWEIWIHRIILKNNNFKNVFVNDFQNNLLCKYAELERGKAELSKCHEKEKVIYAELKRGKKEVIVIIFLYFLLIQDDNFSYLPFLNLCSELVKRHEEEKVILFENDWIDNCRVKVLINQTNVFDYEEYKKLKKEIEAKETALFQPSL